MVQLREEDKMSIEETLEDLNSIGFISKKVAIGIMQNEKLQKEYFELQLLALKAKELGNRIRVIKMSEDK